MLHWKMEGETGRRHAPPTFAGGQLDDLVAAMGARLDYESNAEVFAEGEPAEYLYKMVRGAVRIVKLMRDGRRQISAFYLSSDLFGLGPEDTHTFSAEAAGDSSILVVKRSALLAYAKRDPELVTQLWTHTMCHLQRAQSHMLLLGRKNAPERIAAFLLDMAERLSQSGALELPMSRQDIADYLGLTIETVSRTLTQLQREDLISKPSRRGIVLRDRSALYEMNDVFEDEAGAGDLADRAKSLRRRERYST